MNSSLREEINANLSLAGISKLMIPIGNATRSLILRTQIS